MSEQPAPQPSIPDSPATSKRPWWRLHVSTWVAILLTAAIWGLLNYPARKNLTPVYQRDAPQVYEHGWPFTYLTNMDDIWSWANMLDFHVWPFIGNLAIGLLAIVVFGGCNEFLRRRRTRPWQYSLRTAFLVMTLAGVIMGWCTYRHRTEETAAQHIEELGGRIEWRDGTPVWLRSLLGDHLVDPFRRVQAVGIADDFPAALSDLTALEQLKTFHLSMGGASVSAVMEVQIHGSKELDLHQRQLQSWGFREADLNGLRQLLARFPDLEIVVTPVSVF